MSALSLGESGPPTVKLHKGPDRLVGIAYTDLTTAQQLRLAVFRYGHNLCETCGSFLHGYKRCPKREKQLKYDKKRGRCLRCRSKSHKDIDCPMRRRIEQEAGPAAYDCYGRHAHSLPKKLASIYPATYTSAERKAAQYWLRYRGWCSHCREPHSWYRCRSRLDVAKAARARRVQALIDNQQQLNRGLTGLFVLLSPELRMLIFDKTFKASAPLLVESGYIPQAITDVPFPRGEVLEAWLRTNTFVIRNKEALEHFESLMIRYQVHEHVRALYFSAIDVIPGYAWQRDELLWWYNIVPHFPRLQRVGLPAPSEYVGTWNWTNYRQTIPTYVQRCSFDVLKFKEYKTIKSIVFRGYYSPRSQDNLDGPFEEALDHLVSVVEDKLKDIGRKDIEVTWELHERRRWH